jgi:hypothetical protein
LTSTLQFFFLEGRDLDLPGDEPASLKNISLSSSSSSQLYSEDDPKTAREDLFATLLHDFSELPKHRKATDEAQYAIVNVNPSVVPNPYVPAFRVYVYNTSEARRYIPASTEEFDTDFSEADVDEEYDVDADADVDEDEDDADSDADINGTHNGTFDSTLNDMRVTIGKDRKHGHHRGPKGDKQKCKEMPWRDTWYCRLPSEKGERGPWHSDPASPIRRNGRWTPLGFAQVRDMYCIACTGTKHDFFFSPSYSTFSLQ